MIHGRKIEECMRSGVRIAYLLGLVNACSHDHVHGGLEHVSQARLREELASKSLRALVIVAEEAVPCVL